jgi:hypothetical protein
MPKVWAIQEARYFYPFVDSALANIHAQCGISDYLRKYASSVDEYVATGDTSTVLPSGYTPMSGWVANEVTMGMTHKFLQEGFEDGNSLIWSVDYAQFDSTISYSVLLAAFKAVLDKFVMADTSPETMARVMARTPLLTPLGLWQRRKGVASGSVFTNLVDSIAQAIAYRLAGTDHYMIQGDDGILTVPDYETVDDIQEVIRKMGFITHAVKQITSKDDADYLRNVYNRCKNPYGVRPVMRVVNKLLSYERLRAVGMWKYEDDVMRARQQLHACDWHPALEEVIKWVNGLTREGLKTDSMYREPIATTEWRPEGVEALGPKYWVSERLLSRI